MYNADRAETNYRQGRFRQFSDKSATTAMALQCNALPRKPDASAMQRKSLQAKVSNADARESNAVQLRAEQSNVNQGDVKHQTIHMQMRRRAMPWNTKQSKEPNPRNLGTQRTRDG